MTRHPVRVPASTLPSRRPRHHHACPRRAPGSDPHRATDPGARAQRPFPLGLRQRAVRPDVKAARVHPRRDVVGGVVALRRRPALRLPPRRRMSHQVAL